MFVLIDLLLFVQSYNIFYPKRNPSRCAAITSQMIADCLEILVFFFPQAEREMSTGNGWFNMKAPELTQELKGDLKVLKMRGSLDPKRFYKKNDRDGFPKYFQVSTGTLTRVVWSLDFSLCTQVLVKMFQHFT